MIQERCRHRKTSEKVEVQENLLSGGGGGGGGGGGLVGLQEATARAESRRRKEHRRREACKQLVESGYGTDEEFMKRLLDLYGEK